ncbi:hypothetical protein M9H77_18731 [Catharanthus roseus]|uniref:Uncharacterized protein n=1 Tax=Catharanthus roseus TaxID=4058 RepID=A0ACC0B8G7_CATRO|nr:hypothetical protein M9H77_18731 [Catharanthus roseus]
MRAIIVYSRCNIVGITINEYYVNQACALNKNASLDLHYEVVPGDFLEMLLDDNSFEGAYSIEATCHAQKLEDGYAEVFRVLKLRTLYVSYKRVTTDKHNTRNPEHMVIIQGIKRGDALPGNQIMVAVLETLGITPRALQKIRLLPMAEVVGLPSQNTWYRRNIDDSTTIGYFSTVTKHTKG